MKKVILQLFVLVFCASSFIMAQPEITIGPTVGINFATFNGKDANQMGNLSSKTGMNVGAFLNYHFSDLFALQPEVIYTMKGTDGTTTFNNLNYNLTYSINYIEVPVLLKVYIPIEGSKTIRPSLYAGPAFAFKVASNLEVSGNGVDQTVDESSDTKSFDFGLAFGGGVGFVVGTGILDVSFRYTMGLSTIDGSASNMTVTNGVMSIIANYGFNL